MKPKPSNNEEFILIGLMGKAGSGKTTTADILVKKYGFTKVSFSDPLKQMLVKAGLLKKDEAFGEKTPLAREMLQKIGTDLIRNQIDQDFWVRLCRNKIAALSTNGIKKIVIDDVRFPNEYHMVKSLNGFVVKIQSFGNNNNNMQSVNNHESEVYADYMHYDFLIVNDKSSRKELEKKIDTVLKKINNTLKKSSMEESKEVEIWR